MINRVLPPTPRFLAGPEIAFVRVDIQDRTVGQPPVFVGREPELEGLHDDTREALLNREDILDRTVVLVQSHRGSESQMHT